MEHWFSVYTKFKTSTPLYDTIDISLRWVGYGAFRIEVKLRGRDYKNPLCFGLKPHYKFI